MNSYLIRKNSQGNGDVNNSSFSRIFLKTDELITWYVTLHKIYNFVAVDTFLFKKKKKLYRKVPFIIILTTLSTTCWRYYSFLKTRLKVYNLVFHIHMSSRWDMVIFIRFIRFKQLLKFRWNIESSCTPF